MFVLQTRLVTRRLTGFLTSPVSISNALGTSKKSWERLTRTQIAKFFIGLRLQKLCC